MQYEGNISNVKLYNFALEADLIWKLFHNKILHIGWEKDSCLANQVGNVYYMVDANMYSQEQYIIDSLSIRIMCLLSAMNRKLFHAIWPPKKNRAEMRRKKK